MGHPVFKYSIIFDCKEILKSIEFPSRRHDYSGLGSWEERLEPELVDLLMLLASQGGHSNYLKIKKTNISAGLIPKRNFN